MLFSLLRNEIADTMKRSYPGIDQEFRKHSAVRLRNLFISDKIKLSAWSINYPESARLRNFVNYHFEDWEV